MSFSLLRASVARTAARSAAPRAASRALPRAAFRKYSTPPPASEAPKSSNTGLLIGVAGAILVGGGYFFFSSSSDATDAKSPIKAKINFVPTQEDYQKVYNKIAELLDEAGDYDDGSYGPVILRLAWHSSGTYDVETKTGGSNYATMRFEPESLHGANAGLDLARGVMEKIKVQFPWISYGDLWTLGGVAAVQEMAGPKIPWRAGRVDGYAEQATPDGRLPDATQGAAHLRAIFGRMGFNDQEIVALSGAHALGRCHANRSGFEGPWTFSPTTLTNDYFKLLFSESWVWKKWTGPKQLEDKKTKTLMMLPTDYVIIQDKSFKKFAKAYSDDNELFFKDFAAVVAKLFELGVPQFSSPEPWVMKTLDEQK
ncbi:heme peroxidase [Roridomyces roridus]|uniref:Peroxidase n=1 Tax=Roridomyces roridus TaxID=1738132 RepID=A0AAD7CGH8_9AGAR|nr:heme peroxidase [Roridomyces roridus]